MSFALIDRWVLQDLNPNLRTRSHRGMAEKSDWILAQGRLDIGPTSQTLAQCRAAAGPVSRFLTVEYLHSCCCYRNPSGLSSVSHNISSQGGTLCRETQNSVRNLKTHHFFPAAVFILIADNSDSCICRGDVLPRWFLRRVPRFRHHGMRSTPTQLCLYSKLTFVHVWQSLCLSITAMRSRRLHANLFRIEMGEHEQIFLWDIFVFLT